MQEEEKRRRRKQASEERKQKSVAKRSPHTLRGSFFHCGVAAAALWRRRETFIEGRGGEWRRESTNEDGRKEANRVVGVSTKPNAYTDVSSEIS
jgi:hypothetical protein